MGNKKVVIIDDDEAFLEGLEKTLSASGYDPLVVTDPLSAVEIAIEKKPDVILLELRMPCKNGFELADEMNRALETQSIPIIAMSEFFKEESFSLMNLCMNLCGIKKYLKKPLHPLEVISAIEDVIKEKGDLWQR